MVVGGQGWGLGGWAMGHPPRMYVFHFKSYTTYNWLTHQSPNPENEQNMLIFGILTFFGHPDHPPSHGSRHDCPFLPACHHHPWNKCFWHSNYPLPAAAISEPQNQAWICSISGSGHCYRSSNPETRMPWLRHAPGCDNASWRGGDQQWWGWGMGSLTHPRQRFIFFSI